VTFKAKLTNYRLSTTASYTDFLLKGGRMGSQVLEYQLNESVVSPYAELVAYEFLYSEENASLKRIADLTVNSKKLPSQAMADRVGMLVPDVVSSIENLIDTKLGKLSVAVSDTPSWPEKLKSSKRPTPLIYYYGDIGLAESRSISIVGARKSSDAGLARARRLAKELASMGITVVSGLAAGVDTAALWAAMEEGGSIIGVIGTPIDEYYPKMNKDLQDRIGEEHLLISQVPFYRYSKQPFKTKRYYFPERNELMAAISDATVIIEASDTSGTLTQARACMQQQRPLFILRSCYEDTRINWPKKMVDQYNYAHVVSSSEEIRYVMGFE
jgi:DNA processing protein